MRKLLLGVAFLLVSAATAQADDGWTVWGDNFTKVMTDCVKAAQPNCLSKAFTDKERPAVGTYTADNLYRDLAAAEVMIHQPDAASSMKAFYGIDSDAYLGTGYSVPVVGDGAYNYEYGRQREYFATNLCADVVDQGCTKKDPGVWTWQLDAKTLTQWLDKPFAKFIRAHWPKSEAKRFAARYAPTAKPAKVNLPPLIIRFGSLPASAYKGNVGRPGSLRVFFADFEQARTKTLRNAIVATGAASLLPSPGNASNTFFIWIYAPDANSPAALASWKELFSLLSQPAP